MAQASAELDFRFLYRQGEGVIGRAAWARASAAADRDRARADRRRAG